MKPRARLGLPMKYLKSYCYSILFFILTTFSSDLMSSEIADSSYRSLGQNFYASYFSYGGLNRGLPQDFSFQKFANDHIKNSQSKMQRRPLMMMNFYEIFDKACKGLEVEPKYKTLVSSDCSSDLGLFFGSEKGYFSLSSALNRTKTIFGNAVFDKILASPTIDQDLLKKRQNIIKHLVDNPRFLESIESRLDQIVKDEVDLAYFFSQDQLSDPNSVLNPSYKVFWNEKEFPYKITSHTRKFWAGLNYKEKIMIATLPFMIYNAWQTIEFAAGKASRGLKNAERGWDLADENNLGFWNKCYYGLRNFSWETLFKDEESLRLDNLAKSSVGNVATLKQIADYRAQINPSFADQLSDIWVDRKTGEMNNPALALVKTGLFPFIKMAKFGSPLMWCYAVCMKFPFDTGKDLFSTFVKGFPRAFSITHARLNGSAKVLNQIENLRSDIQGFFGDDFSSKLDASKGSKELKNIAQTLGHSAFKKTPSFLRAKSFFICHHGRIVSTAKLMQKDSSHMAKMLEAVGEVDAYCAMARFIIERNKHKNKICFVEYLNQSSPKVEMQNCWNPLVQQQGSIKQNPLKIDFDKVVGNEVSLGHGAKARHMMLTGPNASGKSTFIRSVIYSIILGQTFGVAFADKSSLTPFRYIDSFDRPKDGASEGLSGLGSQLKKLNFAVTRIEFLLNMKEKDFSAKTNGEKESFAFFAGDEICKETNEFDAALVGISTSRYIANKFPNALWILSSHASGMPLVESETGGKFKNYKVDSDRSPSGKVIWKHKVIPGINDISTCYDVLKIVGFNPEVMSDVKRLSRILAPYLADKNKKRFN